MALYYNLDPATQYYLFWIPKLALSVELPSAWKKEIINIDEGCENIV
jgi:hypothetical protein